MEIYAIDFFSGVGGLSLGLSEGGINVVSGIDLDSKLEEPYTKNIINKDGTRPEFIAKSIYDVSDGDLKKWQNKEGYKLIAGCAPCQPFSTHQKDKKNRNKHAKWGLLFGLLGKIKKYRPDFVVSENVPGLLKESVFTDFLEGMKEAGYYVSYSIENAGDFGVPQRRKRFLLVASLHGKISLDAVKVKPKTVRETIGHLPPIENGEIHKSKPLHVASKLSGLNLKRIKASKPGGTWRDWPFELLPDCYKKESGRSYGSVYARMEWDKVSPTLTTQFNRFGTGRFGHPDQDRAISLLEGALIQTFPEKFDFSLRGIINVTKTALWIGNAVPVLLGKKIGDAIINHKQKINN
jgi:DNA (cytosine-5)-methyltransferase 1